MKKLIYLSLLGFIALMLQSCSINSDITYHKDAASSTLMDMDFREMITMMKSQGGEEAQKGMGEMDKLPKDWTTLYDLQKKEGKKVSDHPDSIRLMKKMFIKGNFVVNELTGMSMKFDRFTKADYMDLAAMSKKEGEKMPMGNNNLNDWDGKKLVIDTDKLSLKDFEKLMAGEQGEGEEKMDPEQMKAMMTMMMKKFTINLKFENDIKSITGKHDWIKQIDKRTVQINYDTSNLDESKKLTNKDKQIVIITE